MRTLNSFLRNLPELVVDNLRFERNSTDTEYILREGVWKFRKIGYNDYDVKKLTAEGFSDFTEWSSSVHAGDVYLLGMRISLTGVIVTLGGDAPDLDD